MSSLRAATSLLRQQILGFGAARRVLAATVSAGRCSTCDASGLRRQVIAWKPAQPYSTSPAAEQSSSPVERAPVSAGDAQSTAVPASAPGADFAAEDFSEDGNVFYPQSAQLDGSGVSPYTVERCGPSGSSLPVYTEYKNNRSRVFTIVRKVSGDVDALKRDMQLTLPTLVQAAISPKLKVRDVKPYKPRSGRKMPKYELIKAVKSSPDADALSKKGIVPTGGKIILEGKLKREVEDWLSQRGF
ncbi:hypothetical protein K437DRAFT_259598 [Tilletiaria anomala UBC 951]|uniref:Large ribosomal subunit protein mL49 n=1 Tax=Tilletiaria anomala (strain ATCC 24038 / CBS 436.72 / UBC 951) TaxID=1037660 RepID=A0A066VHA1_TILAU|nr:uncharacterized protein K437DRAFT_259598 [Tilletiaria anomala UBC 951]KDN37945.1 hypothetical protein K437DRAFT_259598 [Tilletiaria anomala UBC 951]